MKDPSVLSPQSSVLPFDTSGINVLFAALLVLLALSSGTAPVQPARAAGAAGIVIRHSNGRLVYALVPLAGDGMTGAEALQKAGLDLNVSVGGSFGVAVCTIDGEGCQSPKEDCFCKSYGDPALYWHYYQRNADGSWRTSALGAGNRILHDGDVDGWSWTGGDSNLPPVTLEQIAAAVQSTGATPTPIPAPAVSTAPAPAALASALTAPTETTPPRSAAAIIAPNGTATPLAPAAKPSDPSRGRAIGGFVAVAAVMLALLALVPLGARRRRRRTED
ncbi:MAG: hypothetical protein ACR2JW_16470 [Thermomicrobiales bacterium]